MRWLGALSLARLVSGTMRTPLVWTLRVTISPWNSLPDFLKEPMLAMSFLLAGFEPATTAASMAIGRPEALDDAPARGPERSGGWRRGTFLPREEWANRGPHGACPVGWKAQGKKVSPALLRLRRSRRSRPSAKSGQGEAVWSACRAASSGEDVADVEGFAQEVRLSRRRQRSSGVQKGRRHDRIDPDRRWRSLRTWFCLTGGRGPAYPSAARG